jgi:hypothetical protein
MNYSKTKPMRFEEFADCRVVDAAISGEAIGSAMISQLADFSQTLCIPATILTRQSVSLGYQTSRVTRDGAQGIELRISEGTQIPLPAR